jgi:hypothetical protein
MAVKYLQWNHIIGDFFFNIGKADKLVPFVLSQEEVIAIGKSSPYEELQNADGETILQSFKSAWRAGYPGLKGNYISRILEEDAKAIQYYKAGRYPFYCDAVKVSFHPTIMHLAGINLAIIEGKEYSRYKRICDFFNIPQNSFPYMTEALNWNLAWEHLVWWTNDFMKGNLGLLPSRSLSSEKFAYMGKPYTFILLSPAQLNDYYRYLYDNDVEPQSTISENNLIKAFKSVRKTDTLSSVFNESEPGNADTKLVFAILKQLYLAWDGSYTVNSETTSLKTAYQSRKLRLSFEFDDNGYLIFSYRFKEESLNGNQLQINGQLITFGANQWSTPIPLRKIVSEQSFTDPAFGVKLLFRPAEPKYFLFTNGRPEGLHSDIFIETPNLIRATDQYLLAANDSFSALQEWMQLNKGEDISQEILSKEFQLNWRVIYFRKGFHSSHPDIEQLQFPTEERLEIQSGLKGGNYGEFIAGFQVLMRLTGASGNETLQLKNEDIHELTLTGGQTFEVPSFLKADEYELSLTETLSNVKLPYGGKLKIADYTPIVELLDDLEDILAFPNEQTSISVAYHQSITLVNNNLFTYPPPPQFNLWQNDTLNIDHLDKKSLMSIRLLDYLVTRMDISKAIFDEALTVMTAGMENELDTYADFSKLSIFSLNSLRESSRVRLSSQKNGGINRIAAIKPWLFRLGNYQNFFVEGVRSGLQPFKGRLYGLGGCYTLNLLISIKKICESNEDELIIYSEDNTSALVPPSVFIYTKNDEITIHSLCQLLQQDEILPFYRYLAPAINVTEKIDAFTTGRMWDLHDPQRYQEFDAATNAFRRKPDIKTPHIPSLALYEIKPWEKYYILRFTTNNITYQGETEPRWGKYIIHFLNRQTDLFIFDQQKNTLCVPAALRLPVELENDLFYSTGRLPGKMRLTTHDGQALMAAPYPAGKLYLIYRGVIKNTAETIAGRLGQQLTYKTLINHD